ncbi:hypothetical protein chiPu_0001660 [Chiloscyllium punctatum]|uniref:Uncharacterized protein n=1 Tax=Chiloscyllium punctatum TaxID=137246 RepID=A0A401RYP6_CHIPU|nr:hypothetical protein [Chiloscyllium punctatum]
MTECSPCPAGFACESPQILPKKCPIGTYSLEGSTLCSLCPPGSACPYTSSIPVPCIVGSYSTSGQQNCTMCRPGYACSNTTKAEDVQCFPGYYCDDGITPKQCRSGTYGAHRGLKQASECSTCPAGFYCPGGTAGYPSTDLLCPSGYYCKEGTSQAHSNPCPHGTSSDEAGLKSQQGCKQCSEGRICAEGTADGGRLCSKGKYCPAGTTKELDCPRGTVTQHQGASELGTIIPRSCGTGRYSDFGSASCDLCLLGHYCNSERTSWEVMSTQLFCPAGLVCPVGLSRVPDFNKDGCPKGYYCLQGNIDPNPRACPNGTYSDRKGLVDESQCVPCPAGKYCYSEGTKPVAISQPTGDCPGGHYCPLGTGNPHTFPCKPGFYLSHSAAEREESCSQCPPGYYCESFGLENPKVCPKGFYCILGSKQPQPCQRGTYSDKMSLRALSDCIPCGGGQYCAGESLTQPTGNCKAGFYCRERAVTAAPLQSSCSTCLRGRYCNQTGLVSPPFCIQGHYCPTGSILPIPCPVGYYLHQKGAEDITSCKLCDLGMYCSVVGLAAPEGPCQPGYYCTSGSNTSVPVELSFGDVCPAGYYCPLGTKHAFEKPCPTGTWNNITGAQDITFCLPCPPGYACHRMALTQPSRLCAPGFYCKERATTTKPLDGETGDLCPEGHYCPEGTAMPLQCGDGSYNNVTGLAEPSGECSPGYYCIRGATKPQNTDGITGNLCPGGSYCGQNVSKAVACPPGHYCPEGSAKPKLCDSGSWQDLGGRAECKPCVAGYYCDNRIGPVVDIELYPCPAGFYCPVGTQAATQYGCPPGTFSPNTRLKNINECQLCLPGQYCASFGLSAPSGFYCPEGTSYDWQPCPPGTYSPVDGLARLSECRPCDGGKYCAFHNAVEVTGECWEGYYCVEGSDSPAPELNHSGKAGPCPVGHYCPYGTSSPKPCPLGTFSNQSKLVLQSDCMPCIFGHYCGSEGLEAPSGECWEGFYCLRGAKMPNNPVQDDSGGPCPQGHYCERAGQENVTGLCAAGYYCMRRATTPTPTDGISGNVCPPGHFCVTGASSPQPCPAGYYSNSSQNTKVDDCLPCPPGLSCDRQGLVSASRACTKSASRFPCPLGTFSNQTGIGTIDDCLLCPPGKYCDRTGLTEPTGDCWEGYYCNLKSSSPKPSDEVTGWRCPRGSYCPRGTKNIQFCPVGYYGPVQGYYCDRMALTIPSGLCQAGFYCVMGSNTSRPTQVTPTGGPCPPGYYCTEGSSRPQPCPTGTYNPFWEQKQCLFCPQGHYCEAEDINSTLCPSELNSVKTHRYPSGRATPKPCPSGEYQDQIGQIQCKPCPLGKHCDPLQGNGQHNESKAGTIQPIDCPAGYYCIKGMLYPCPEGTYSNQTGRYSIEQCKPCPGGKYCALKGMSGYTGLCDPGCVCVLGASYPCPADNITGYKCPPGSYCPQGASHGIKCPAGTFGPQDSLYSIFECITCTPGFYCNTEGDCTAGFYCISGASRPSPIDGITGGRCPLGHYCPTASSQPLKCKSGYYCPRGTMHTAQYPCPVGTYNNRTMAQSVLDCISCPAGQYCDRKGLSTPSGICPPGFYCPGAVCKSQPEIQTNTSDHHGIQNFTGNICPPGFYCPEGSSQPVPCDLGQYCGQPGLSSPTGPCVAGFLCDGKASVMNPKPCPAGYYCPEGTTYSKPCPPGTLSVINEGCQQLAIVRIVVLDISVQRLDLLLCQDHVGQDFTVLRDLKRPLPLHLSSVTFALLVTSAPMLQLTLFHVHLEHSEPQQGEEKPGKDSVEGFCDPGFYCLNGAKTATPRDGATGDLCPVGYYCPLASPGLKLCEFSNISEWASQKIVSPGNRCPPGFFCPEGSSLPLICTAGFYCDQYELAEPTGFYQALQGQFECNPCPAGSYCYTSELDKWGVKAPQRCPPGHFCPPRTEFGTQYKCPPGTFSNKEGQISAAECDLCPPGQFCGQEGLIEPSGSCLTGFYCFRGAMYPNPTDGITGDICPMGKFCEAGSVAGVDCPIGHYSNKTGLTSPSDCTPCDPGFHCSSPGLTAPQGPCARGYYCRLGAQSPNPDNGIEGAICPAGYYCVSGTERPVPCPVGTYNPSEGRDSVAGCLPCDPGHYCGNIGLIQPSGLCFEGYYCIGHTSQPTPQDGENGGVCPEGFYCQVGTHKPVPCPIGTFLNHSGGTECVVCPAGFYCIYGKKINPCPLGFYCPEGTGADIAPCPAGTYGGRMGLKEENDCFPCKGGFYCARDGLSSPQGKCDPGHYCISGVNIPNPGPTQIFLGKGGKCGAGQQCPSGSVLPQTCPPGTYTEEEGLEHCKTCPAGYYCPPTSMIPKLCPPGYYCPTATEEGTQYPCPPGTFNGQYEWCFKQHYVMGGLCPVGYYCPTGSSTPLPCDGGKYCSNPGLSIPTDGCFAGYYCDAASTQPDQHICPAGFYCPNRTSIPLPCRGGTYQANKGQGSCDPCPAGFFCQFTNGSSGKLYEPCPAGFFCPAGTTMGTEHPCAMGTFGPRPGLAHESSCVPCSPGMHCASAGLSNPTGPCHPGYYCTGSAISPTPIKHLVEFDNATFTGNDVCPIGHYCPEGSQHPWPCPQGSYSHTVGLVSEAQCQRCPYGHYCNQLGLTDVSQAQPCDPGYVCHTGSTVPRPSDGIQGYVCPRGHRCPAGVIRELVCKAGTYNPSPGAGICLLCPAGTVCSNSSTVEPIACPKGYYCSSRTTFPLPCPEGTYNALNGASSADVCLSCPAGLYCQGMANSEPDGPCTEGYYCQGGASSPIPQSNPKFPMNGPCAAGYYCPAGTKSPIACPKGTFKNTTGGASSEFCAPCYPGYYCANEGLSQPNGLCFAGFYCPGNHNSVNPNAFSCPKGYFCSEGSGSPIPCPAGKYQPNMRSDVCIPCQAGFYCKEAATVNQITCPPHFFCPNGTQNPIPCPSGTFTSGQTTGLKEEKQCLPCPTGKYCSRGRIQGFCAAGYFCLAGSHSPIPHGIFPNDTHERNLCFYCPEGTETTKACPENTIRLQPGGRQLEECQPCPLGHWCKQGDPFLHRCPAGYFCDDIIRAPFSLPVGPQKCPVHTYSNITGATSQAACQPCPPGYYCNETGLTSYENYLCPLGYWCPGKGSHHFCPGGTIGNRTGASFYKHCQPCPPGYYCPDPRRTGQPNINGVPCRAGYECPAGSITCKCQGFNRAFQESDGSCICKTGHVYYDETDQKSSNSNSDMDCYPEVYDRCSVGEVRLASTRRCVFPERHNCTPACGEYGGRLDVELGMCHCNKYISAEELCDRVCMAGILNLSAHASHTGELVLTVKNGATRDHKNWVVPHVLGPDGHITDSLRVLFILFKPNGIFGLILSGKYVVDKFLTESEWPDMFQNPHFKTKRSYLQRPVSAAMNGAIPKIPNPIVCLRPNDLILFKLSVHQSNRSLSHYPVYQKDHLFNTNSDWDFGPFRKLDHFIKETNFNISRFAHVFMEPGKYVFYDNAEPERALIVSVNKFGECDNVPSLFQPSSPIHLVQHGILKQQDLNLAPDWALIIGTLCILALITALFTVSAMVMTPIQSVLNPMQKWKPKWRSLGEPYMPPEYIILKDSLGLYETLRPRIAGEGAEAEEESTLIVGKSLAETELEDFSVRTLYDKLEDQNLHLAAQLNKHKSDVQAFYQHISQQTQELKKILECFNSCKCQNKEGKWTFVEELETMSRVQAEASSTMTRDRFGNCTTINFWERSPVTQSKKDFCFFSILA